MAGGYGRGDQGRLVDRIGPPWPRRQQLPARQLVTASSTASPPCSSSGDRGAAAGRAG